MAGKELRGILGAAGRAERMTQMFPPNENVRAGYEKVLSHPRTGAGNILPT